MTEQQDSVAQSPDSVQTTAAVAAVPQQQTVAQTAPVRKGQFEEQLAQLPDSIRQPLQKQLDLLPQSSVMKRSSCRTQKPSSVANTTRPRATQAHSPWVHSSNSR